MRRGRSKFIAIILVMVVAVLPVYAAQAKLFSALETTVETMKMERQGGNVPVSEHCKSKGCASSGSDNMDSACDQAGCDQCGSCAAGLTESTSFTIQTETTEHLLSAINTTLSYQLIPPFRPPRV